MILTGAVAAVAIVLLVGRARSRRIDAVFTAAAPAPAAVESRSPARIALAAATLVAGVAVFGGGLGVVLGLGVAVLVALAPTRARPALVAPDEVPVVIDLIAGCLEAGVTLPDALDAAATITAGLLQDRCRHVAVAARSGATGRDAWQAWFDDPTLAAVARTAVRTSHTGAAAAADLRRIATRIRARRRAAAQHRVRQASVWLVIPLGLCFLPAFVLIAVVPIVIGLLPALQL